MAGEIDILPDVSRGNPRVLIVDDDALVAAVHALKLRQAGFQVEVVGDAQALWPALDRFYPDLVLMDIMMPGQDGVALASAIQSIQQFRSLPIVFVTAHDDPAQLLVAQDFPDAQFISKPVNDHYLCAVVRGRIALSRAMGQLAQLKKALDEHAIVSMADARGNIIYVNDKFCRVSGYSPEELIGQNHRIVKSDEHPPELYQEMWQTIGTGRVWQGELRNRARNGSHYWVETTIVPILDHFGLPESYLSIRTEITRLMETEAALKESEALFRGTFMDAPIGIALKTAEGVYLKANRAFEELTGYSEAELRTMDCHALTHPDDWADTLECHADVARLGADGFHLEKRYVRKDGRVVWVEVSASVLHEGETGSRILITHVTDISRRKQAEWDMRVARDEAQRSSRAKSDFLSSMSHELRTPLNAILGFAQLLRAEAGDRCNASQAESMEQIEKAGWHLLELINEVLDLSRIEAGKLSLSIEDVSLQDVLQDCEKFIAPLAAAAKVQISFGAGVAQGIHARVDHLRLRQALLNLMSNAVKYNHTGGSVLVDTQLAPGGYARVSVADTGIGMSQEQMKNLFQPFSRLGMEAGSIQGSGIGLTICKHLIEMMGGQVGVESRIGEGSLFWIEVPLSPARAVVAQPRGPLAGASPREGHAFRGRGTVLYVEDNPANTRLVERALGRYEGVRLICAADGKTGLDLARQNRPDAILLDINLPDMSGMEVRARLREMEATAGIPVIALSANAMPADVQRVLDTGFQAYLVKPVDIRKLLDTLAEHLKARA